MKRLIALLVLFLAPPSFADAAERPNLVVFIADDIGWEDYGCYGNKSARTPNIDRLAATGRRYSQAFLTASSCSTSRSSIITGRYDTAYSFPASPTCRLSRRAQYQFGFICETLGCLRSRSENKCVASGRFVRSRTAINAASRTVGPVKLQGSTGTQKRLLIGTIVRSMCQTWLGRLTALSFTCARPEFGL
jgi:hypothetical protein